MNKIVTAFEKQNPKITVKAKLLPYADYVTAIKTELASHSGPDVMEIQTGGMLNQFKSLLEPLSSAHDNILGSNWKAGYNKEALSQASISGTAYGLPVGFQTAGALWVNKSILDANNLPVPTTYAELKSDSAALTAKGIVPVAIGAKDDWMDEDIFSAMSNAIAPGVQYKAMAGKTSWTNAGLVKSFDAFANLFKDGIAQEGAAGATTYTDAYDLYADGKAAFFTNGSWNQDMFVSAADRIGKFDAEVIQMPTTAGKAPVVAGIGALIAANKASKNKDAALKLAKFMSSGEGQQILINSSLDFSVTTKPVVPAGTLTSDAVKVRDQLTTLLDKHTAGYREVPDANVGTALGQALIGLAAGTIDAKTAAAQVEAAAKDSSN